MCNPKDIFKYLYQNRIGEHVSLFYVGWAWVLESTANYAQAHKVYLKATQKYVATLCSFPQQSMTSCTLLKMILNRWCCFSSEQKS